MRVPMNSANDDTTRLPARRRIDPLDDAVSLSGPAGETPGEESSDDVLGEDERNATGGALPATDDEDNDNDNDDARERDIPDHLVRDEDE
ncbi:MAG: hypothetical protein ABI846_06005 [Rudaea sp.]